MGAKSYVLCMLYIQKFGVSKIFFMKEVSSAHQGCISLIKKYSKNSKTVKYSYNLKYLNTKIFEYCIY